MLHLCIFRFTSKLSEEIRGVGRGSLGHVPLGAEGPHCYFSAPSNRECVHRENVVGGCPQGALQRRKVPPKSLSNDVCTEPSLGEVAPS